MLAFLRLTRAAHVDPVLNLSECCGVLAHDTAGTGVPHCLECWEAAPGTDIPPAMPCDECFEYDGHTPACGW